MNRIVWLVVFALISFNSISQIDVEAFLIARNMGEKMLSNGDTIRTFGFAPNLGVHPPIPGPTIVANEGDSVLVHLWNVSQGAPHTIHLHGLDVDQQNDGVPQLSFAVEHMDHGYYRFKATHAGTYLYHCHVASPIHVQAGMYGLIVIKPVGGIETTWTGGYYYHEDHNLVFSEIDTVWHNDTILDHAHVDTLDITPVKLPKYEPQFFLINGLSDQQLDNDSVTIETAVGEQNYFRLANIGFYGNRVVFPSSFNCKIVDSDGRPLPQYEVSDSVLIYPGERYGVLVEATEEVIDSIEVQYFDLNTNTIRSVQYIKLSVSGINSILNPEQSIEFKLKPNPANDWVNISYNIPTDGKYMIKIHSLDGRMIEEFELDNFLGSLRLNVKNLVDGTYLVTLYDKGLVISTEKLIKQ